MVNTTVDAPIPSASVASDASVKPGLPRSERIECFMSVHMLGSNQQRACQRGRSCIPEFEPFPGCGRSVPDTVVRRRTRQRTQPGRGRNTVVQLPRLDFSQFCGAGSGPRPRWGGPLARTGDPAIRYGAAAADSDDGGPGSPGRGLLGNGSRLRGGAVSGVGARDRRRAAFAQGGGARHPLRGGPGRSRGASRAWT